MLSIVEQDFGTPKRNSAELVTLTIDGQEVIVPAGTSVSWPSMVSITGGGMLPTPPPGGAAPLRDSRQDGAASPA